MAMSRERRRSPESGSGLPLLRFAHSNVVMQPDYDDPRYSGINPYALGFAMMRDIERVCLDPTIEDRNWFPDTAGCGKPYEVLRDAWANYRDESFVLQYLSPNLMRKFRFFALSDDSRDPAVRISAIHDERGFRNVRKRLAASYDVAAQDPDLQVTDADLSGSRRLVITHTVRNGITLDKVECERTMQCIAQLWGYRVRLVEVDVESGRVLKEHEVLPMPV